MQRILAPQPSSGSRIPELDGVRGMAVLLVVVYHYVGGVAESGTGPLAMLVKSSTCLMWSGVDLFFVLSGYLIGGILIDHRDSANYFRTFYLRRVCRILPIYFLWVALFFVVAGLLSASAASKWYAYNFQQLLDFPKWGYFLFLQNFCMAKLDNLGSPWTSVTWSLCIEEQFYLLMPLIVWLVPRRKLPLMLVLAILAVPLFRLFLYLSHPSLFMYVLLPCRADGLLLGVLCAWLVRNQKCRDYLASKRAGLYFMLVSLFCGMVWLTVFESRQQWFTAVNSFEMISFGYTMITLFYACFLLAVVTGAGGPLAGIMRTSWLRRIGVISYCIYLIHVAINRFIHDLIFGSAPAGVFLNALVTLLSFLIVYSLAALSWRFYEKPIISWGHRFKYESTPSTDASAPLKTVLKQTDTVN